MFEDYDIDFIAYSKHNYGDEYDVSRPKCNDDIRIDGDTRIFFPSENGNGWGDGDGDVNGDGGHLKVYVDGGCDAVSFTSADDYVLFDAERTLGVA